MSNGENAQRVFGTSYTRRVSWWWAWVIIMMAFLVSVVRLPPSAAWPRRRATCLLQPGTLAGAWPTTSQMTSDSF